MKRISSVLALIVACVFATVSHAEVFCRQPTGTVVVFGNGVMNTHRDAAKSMQKLERTLRATLSPEAFSELQFDLAYNESYGLLNDLYEALKQRIGQANVVVSIWRWLGGREEVPEAVREELLKMATKFDFSTMVGEEDLSNHLALYRNSILAGKKVLTVSHSQGNFFANAAHQILYNGPNPIDSLSFGIVAVATPASFVGGGGPYTTLVEDGVIAAVSLATVSGVLPPLFPNLTNVFSGASTSDWRGHNFIDEYMAVGSRSLAKIVPDIVTTLTGLARPPQVAQDGIITVTLRWGDQPDVDLHVYEPNGMHVYYQSLVGVSGYLELDVVTGSGPEHYYVACGSVEEGVYSVGVNYYNGTGPETASVQIVAGNLVRPFSVPLSEAVGSAGNQSPVMVADILVEGNPEAGYSFSIYGR